MRVYLSNTDYSTKLNLIHSSKKQKAESKKQKAEIRKEKGERRKEKGESKDQGKK